MCRQITCLTAAAAAVLLAGSAAQAQFVTYYSPVIAAPAPVVVASPVATVVARPVTTVVARPVTTVAYSPVVAAPAPVAVAPTVVASPVVTSVPVYTTRFRPLLGGSVTRVRYRPVVYYPY